MKITLQQVQLFLNKHFDPVTNVAVLGEGNWSQAFSFESKGYEYAARFGAHLQDFKKDSVAAAFSSKDMPVPDFVQLGQAFEGYFAIAKKVNGEMIDHLDSSDMKRIVPAFLDMLDAMRQIDVSDKAGFGMWDEKGVAPYKTWTDALTASLLDVPDRRVHGWRKKLEASPTRTVAFDCLANHFRQLVHKMPNERHLVHTDLLNRNLLVADNKITGVIDWGNAMYGDFLYDLAHYCFWAPSYPAMDGIDWEVEAKQHYKQIGFHVPQFHERMLCYKLSIALEALIWRAHIEDWEQFETVTTRANKLLDDQLPSRAHV